MAMGKSAGDELPTVYVSEPSCSSARRTGACGGTCRRSGTPSAARRTRRSGRASCGPAGPMAPEMLTAVLRSPRHGTRSPTSFQRRSQNSSPRLRDHCIRPRRLSRPLSGEAAVGGGPRPVLRRALLNKWTTHLRLRSAREIAVPGTVPRSERGRSP